MYELLYTSAPETLDGAGYGAVGKSNQFPVRLEKFIRQHLNQYDLVPGESLETSSQRAVFCYSRLDEAGQTWHILSRAGFGGHDYTQRAVFLAHHVAMSDDEFADANAAALMLDPALFVVSWDGRVGSLAARRRPAVAPASSHCETWKSLSGDPQWAQAFVDRWTQHKGAPQFLIVSDPAATLTLFAEAAELLDPGVSARATFLNNLTSARSGIQWDWIGMAADNEITKSVAARFPDRVFDLTHSLGRAAPARRRPAAVRSRTASAAIEVHTASPREASAAEPSVPDAWDQLIDDATKEAAAKGHQETVRLGRRSPPPPPPVGWKPSRMFVAALVAGVGLSTAGGWWLHTMLSEPPRSQVAQKTPDTNSNREKPVAVEAPISEKQSPSPSAVPPNDSPPLTTSPDLKFVDLRGLLETAQNSMTDALVTKLNGAESKLPMKCGMRLRFPKAFELNLTTEKSKAVLSDRSNMEITATFNKGERQSTARFYLLDSALRCKCTGEQDLREELLKRLQFSVLEIYADSGAVRRSVRLAFTPLLPALPLKDDRQDSSKDLRSLLAAARELNVGPPRIDRLSLSILPPENKGWPWTAPTKGASIFDIKSRAQSYSISVTIKDQDKDGSESDSNPPICKFEIKPSRPNEKTVPPGEAAGSAGFGHGKTDGKNHPAEKRSDQLENVDPKATNLETELRLLQQMFERFGELHGRVVVDAEGEEIEVLRFGSPEPAK